MNARDVELLQQDLRKRVRGEVFFDRVARGLYSTDASNYRSEPVGVCVVRDAEDVRAAVETAGNEH